MSAKLIFVYNADTGVFNTLSDSLHKFFSPSTYSCNLCALTHHHFGAREEWKAFIQQISLPMEFLHKDEFIKLYDDASVFTFPCLIKNESGENKVMISAQEINSFTDLDQLKDKIKEILET